MWPNLTTIARDLVAKVMLAVMVMAMVVMVVERCGWKYRVSVPCTTRRGDGCVRQSHSRGNGMSWETGMGRETFLCKSRHVDAITKMLVSRKRHCNTRDLFLCSGAERAVPPMI